MLTAVKVTVENSYKTTQAARQHIWYGDAPVQDGGTDEAATPEELVMGALGSCMAMTGQMYANRKGWPVERIEVTLDFQRFNASDYPAYQGDANFVHEIHEHITIEGPLSEEQKTRILEIMGKCPVRRLIGNPVFFAPQQVTE
ncbi:MAG: hypothetical protein OHK0046_09880 [Anaerolineae bacterium]